ncbi:hypothetical protein RV18_GL000954 [Enterococcus termitis]|nr:hypothetical protein RV18_GL000954 [Enterococcus termitis]
MSAFFPELVIAAFPNNNALSNTFFYICSLLKGNGRTFSLY